MLDLLFSGCYCCGRERSRFKPADGIAARCIVCAELFPSPHHAVQKKNNSDNVYGYLRLNQNDGQS